MAKYSSLHNHYDASPDALGKLSDTVEYAKSVGFQHLGMSNHGTMSQTIEFLQETKKQGIKPVIGCESYVRLKGFKERFHLTIFANGDAGWINLLKLQNRAHNESDTGGTSATIDLDWLEDSHEGLVILTGCQASPFQVLPLEDAVELLRKLKRFGVKDIYSEAMFVSENNSQHFQRALELSGKMRLPLVVTNDVHFAREEDYDLKQLLMKMRGYDYSGNQLWMKTGEDIYHHAKENIGVTGSGLAVVQSGLDTSWELAEAIVTPSNILRSQQTPYFLNAKEYLDAIISKRLLSYPTSYSDRATYEMAVVSSKGFDSYFAVLHDIIQYGRSKGVVCDARGSGCGSLLLFLLDITTVDPIVYGTQFERFLNPSRVTLPDVDMDIDSSKRHILINYAVEKYGAKRVGAYSHMSVKTITHSLSRILNFKKTDEEELLEMGELAACVGEYPIVARAFKTMDEQINIRTQHAAGIVMAVDGMPLPEEKLKDGTMVVAFAESSHTEDLADAGGVKFDFLGVSAMTTLSDLIELTGKHAPMPHEMSEADSRDIYELARNGKTVGVFQFDGSDGIRKLLMQTLNKFRWTPEWFEHLVAVTSLYRPGVFANSKGYLEGGNYYDPGIDVILKPTNGAMLYQEQMMSIFQYVVKGTLADADTARRIISKFQVGKEKELNTLRDRFYEVGIKHLRKETLDNVWKLMLQATGYSFNRSHGVAYSAKSMQMWWYRLHFPEAYFTACLNSDPDKKQEFLYEAVSEGIELVQPNVNISSDKYELRDKRIYLPINLVKGLGPSCVTAIMQQRGLKPFYDMVDFRNRLTGRQCNSTLYQKLVNMGAFETGHSKDYQAQLDAIGFVIPTKNLIDRLKQLSKGQVGGIVTGHVLKETEMSGKFVRYFCLPSGTFWIKHPHEEAYADNTIVFGDALQSGRLVRWEKYTFEQLDS